jgi:glycosyltransferase involved in cell wall biosynthesis
VAPTVLQLGPLYSIHLRRWAENAAAVGYRVHIAGHVASGTRAATFEDLAESVHAAPQSRRPLTTVSWALWLRRLLERLRPSVVHAHQLQVWGLYAALAGARPVVLSAWGSDVYLASRYARTLSRLAIRRADKLLAPSPHLISTLVDRGAPEKRCSVVDLGVDLDAFSPVAGNDRDQVRAELGLGDGPIVFSFRGGFSAYNLPIVVEAFIRLQRRVPEARLLVAYGGATPAGATRRALERPELAGAVHVLGEVAHEDMPRYFGATTVGLSIPSSDGSPRSVWEAMACAVPVVVSDLPQLRQRLGESGAAKLVPVDAAEVAAALEELILNDEEAYSIGLAGREWAVANVDRREHLARLGRAYAEVTAPKSA